jgi:hypothetical protein
MLGGCSIATLPVHIVVGPHRRGLATPAPSPSSTASTNRSAGQAWGRLCKYLNEFHVTSGHVHRRSLFATIAELGLDRVMLSAA